MGGTALGTILSTTGMYTSAEVDALLVPAAWTEVSSFSNSWVNFDAVREARYFKDPFGIVHLGGVVKSGTIGAAVFTLPVGYRPDYADATTPLIFPVASNGAFGVCAIEGDGEVIASAGSNVYFSFDGITFRAA